jgi:hypothetical protein
MIFVVDRSGRPCQYARFLYLTNAPRDRSVGDLDGDGHAESVVSSPWGVGVLKLAGDQLTAPMMAPNGTRFGGWLLNTADNQLGTVLSTFP